MEEANEIIKEITADSTTIPPCSNICTSGCCCDCDCGKGGQALCIANSVCATNIIIGVKDPTTASVSVTIPANSCITKIYASLPTSPSNVKYVLIEVNVGATTIFCHGLSNLGSEDPIFDTTLVQPLCVGNTRATAKVTALNTNNGTVNAHLTLTVVYCPNCC